MAPTSGKQQNRHGPQPFGPAQKPFVVHRQHVDERVHGDRQRNGEDQQSAHAHTLRRLARLRKRRRTLVVVTDDKSAAPATEPVAVDPSGRRPPASTSPPPPLSPVPATQDSGTPAPGSFCWPSWPGILYLVRARFPAPSARLPHFGPHLVRGPGQVAGGTFGPVGRALHEDQRQDREVEDRRGRPALRCCPGSAWSRGCPAGPGAVLSS